MENIGHCRIWEDRSELNVHLKAKVHDIKWINKTKKSQ